VDSQTLVLPSAIYGGIVTHALEGKPEEVCGLLRGNAGLATKLLRAKNVAPNRIMDYEVDPDALVTLFDWEEAGDELIAIYHSHPAGPAYPSASDAYQAYYPDTVFLICSLLDGTEPVLRGFFLRELPGKINLEDAQKEIAFEEARPGRWAAYIPDNHPSPSSLAHLDRPLEQALYVVYQQQQSSGVAVRAVTIKIVDVVIE